ncbi:MAG: ComEC/Rec2 family competence protein, partial [Phycisphaerales bacterium]|nr:ComEC/Rec2 family competence protein [Phycisphaerales bacterium]
MASLIADRSHRERGGERAAAAVIALHRAPASPARRGVWALGAMVLGILGARAINAPGVLPEPISPAACFGVVCLLAALAGVMRWGVARVLLWVAMVFVGAGAWSLRVDHAPQDELRQMLSAREAREPSASGSGGIASDASPSERAIPIAVVGYLRSDPRQYVIPPVWADVAWTPGVFTRVELAIRRVGDPGCPIADMVRSEGVVSVIVQGRFSTARAGDLVRVTGELRGHPGPANAIDTDFRPRHAQADNLGVVLAAGCERISPQDAAPDGEGLIAGSQRAWSAMLGSLRRAAEAGMMLNARDGRIHDEARGDADTRAPARALIGAMLLGTEGPELAPINQSFARLGLIHALSISGFHLALLAGLTLLILRLIADFGRWEYAIVAAVVGVYVLVVPADAPVIRSAAMIGAFLLAAALGRAHDRVNTLGWIACGLLLARPADVLSPGFQLSVGVTAALIWLSPWAGRMMSEPELKGVRRTPVQLAAIRIKHALVASIATALVAWLVSAPTIIDHTGIVGPMGFISSLLALPVLTLTLCCSYAALGAGLIAHAASAIAPAWMLGTINAPAVMLWSLTEWLAQCSLSIANLLDTLPGGAWAWPAMPTWWTILATVSICAALRWGRSAALAVSIGLGLSVLYVSLAILSPGTLRDAGTARLIEVDAGNGRCVVVRDDAGDGVIIDAGSTSPSNAGALPSLA